jgi:hypothetical protein
MRSLVRIDPDHHASHPRHLQTSSANRETAAGTSEFRTTVALAPL